MKTIGRLVVAVSAILLAARAAHAQQTPGAELRQVLVSRQALEDLATRLEQTAESRSVSSEQRARARSQAALVRRRLTEGDFQVGDRLLLKVDGETALSDTFTVEPGQVISLPGIGPFPLGGVLRVELKDRITPFIAQYVRDPKVHAQALIRIAVFGGVSKQGYYTLPVDLVLSDVVAIAGGFSATAIIDKMTIERRNDVLYEGEQLQDAIAEGRTLDALSIRAGDRIKIPEQSQRNPLQRVQAIQALLTMPLSIYALIQLFK